MHIDRMEKKGGKPLKKTREEEWIENCLKYQVSYTLLPLHGKNMPPLSYKNKFNFNFLPENWSLRNHTGKYTF